MHNEQWIAWTKQDELWCKKEINVNVAHNGERNSLSESLRNTLGEKSYRGDEIHKLENAHQTIRFFFSGHMHFLRIIGWDKKKRVHVESILKRRKFPLVWICILAWCAFLELVRESRDFKRKYRWIIGWKFSLGRSVAESSLAKHQVLFLCS